MPDGGHQERQRPRLLIADDDPVVLSTLTMALDDTFEIVAAVTDGEEAVAQAATCEPDAALIDVEMPKGGAPRAVRGIVEVSPRTAIVVLSGDETDAVVRELLQAGAVSYRRKGIHPHKLAGTIAESIRAHRGQAPPVDP